MPVRMLRHGIGMIPVAGGGVPAGSIQQILIAANGFMMGVRHEGGASTGAWEYGGLDRTNGRFLNSGVDQFPLTPDSVSPKIILQVQDVGYNRVSGQAVAGTRTRTLVATKAIRKAWPFELQLNETDNGDGTHTTWFALSERIYSSSVVQLVSFLDDWRVGEQDQILAPPNITNSSTRVPSPLIARWATHPYKLIAGTSGTPVTSVELDIVGASHHPSHDGSSLHQAFAGIRVMSTDGTNANYGWATVRNSSLHGDNLRCWGITADLTGLNPGFVTHHFEAFPWIGNSRATGTMTSAGHSTSITGSNTQAFEQPLQNCYDPTGTRYVSRIRRVFINSSSTNTATTTTGTNDAGSVTFHTTVSAARSAATSTKPASLNVAIAAARAFLDSNSSLNLANANGISHAGTRAADFWEFILTDGQTHTFGPTLAASGTSLNGREGMVKIIADPDATDPKTTTILNSPTTRITFQVTRFHMANFQLRMGEATMFDGSGSTIILENIRVRGKTGFETNTFGWYASTDAARYVVQQDAYSYGAQPSGLLVRNSVRSRATGGSCIIGVRIIDESGVVRTTLAFTTGAPDVVIMNCRVDKWSGSLINLATGTGSFGNRFTTYRHALLNVIMEGVPGNAHMQVGEFSYTNMEDCIYDSSTIIGGRLNWHSEAPIPVTAVGSTVTIGLSAHGYSVGDSVTIAGITPSGYNGTFTIASVPNADTFTYNAGSSPAGVSVYTGATVTRSSVTRPILRAITSYLGNTLLSVVLDRNATKQDNQINDTSAFNPELLYGIGHKACVRANRGISTPSDWQYAYGGVGTVTDTVYGFQDNPTPYENWHGFVEDGIHGTETFIGDYHPKISFSSRLIGIGSISNIDRDYEGTVRGTVRSSGALEAVA